jgi:hypothetical protein
MKTSTRRLFVRLADHHSHPQGHRARRARAGGLDGHLFRAGECLQRTSGVLATKAIDSNSIYEKLRHADLAQQRFPDLRHRDASEPPSTEQSFECKESKRLWAVQSHYNHPGWYIVWRYLVAQTCAVEAGRPVLVLSVDLVYLEEDDWKYEGGSAGPGGGGRTHTFGLKRTAAKLLGKDIHARSDVRISAGKAVSRNGD